MDRTFFITSVTAQRRAIFRHDPTAILLLETLLHYRSQAKYLLHEFVVMPDHFHALITPSGEISLEKAVQFIKGGFSHRLHSRVPVWQSSFTNHRIRDVEDFEHHREYIRMNPVNARLRPAPEDWKNGAARGRVGRARLHRRRSNRSADWQSAVSQVGNLRAVAIYRRVTFIHALPTASRRNSRQTVCATSAGLRPPRGWRECSADC